MKKLIIICAALATMNFAFAQSKEAEAVKKKLDKVEASTQDPKKGATSGPWIEKANVLIDASNVYTGKLIQGFALEQVVTLIGQPQSQESVEFKGEKYTKYAYDNFNVYINGNNQIAFWDATAEVVPGALNSAYASLLKAKEISPKDFTGTAKGASAALKLKAQLQTDGMSKYSRGKFIEAAQDFETAVSVAALTGAIDTMFIYYAGVAYSEGNKFESAAPLFEKLLSMGSDQDGMVYYYLSQGYLGQNDPTKATVVLEEAFKKYPNNGTIVASLINAYLASKQDPSKVVAMVKQAQEIDPSNVSLFLVESSVYNEIGDRVNAYAALEKAISVDPKYFDAYFNYAVMKILEAEDVRKESEKIDINDSKSYDAAMLYIVELQDQAIEKLEKAFELNPKNFDVVDLLRQLYFPKREQKAEQYAKYEALSKSMKAE